MKLLTIGQVARRAGLGVETVRFYEREGLLDKPARKQSGYRQYAEDAVRVLRFIQRAKRLGFTLKEIKGLLELQNDRTATRADVKQRAEGKLADIQARIDSLERMKTVLLLLSEACDGIGPLAGCPILDALTKPDDDAGDPEDPSGDPTPGGKDELRE